MDNRDTLRGIYQFAMVHMAHLIRGFTYSPNGDFS